MLPSALVSAFLFLPPITPYRCTIRGEASCELGKAPSISVVIINPTKKDIYLVGSLDGSSHRWRYPQCYFEVIGPDGQDAVRASPRCGNMNDLRVKDFVKVAAGKEFDPFQKIDGYGFFPTHQLNARNFQVAGEYRIRFVYSTNNNDITAWGGDGRDRVAKDEELVGLFRQVPKLEVRSNEIRIRFAPGK